MKGKTGKPSAMRGGGMARKGVGMALKGGGMARKGTGSNATPGGKVAKMAMGGKPDESAMAKAEASRSTGSSGGLGGLGSSTRDGGFGGAGKTGGGSNAANSVKPLTDKVLAQRASDVNKAVPTGIIQRAMFRRRAGDPDDMSLRKSMLDASASRTNRDLGLLRNYGADAMRARSFMSADRPAAEKKAGGGKVSRYAKGGSIKMTAGSGSGSGRLEKVSAHKAAKRIPATGLKKGGKVKGK